MQDLALRILAGRLFVVGIDRKSIENVVGHFIGATPFPSPFNKSLFLYVCACVNGSQRTTRGTKQKEEWNLVAPMGAVAIRKKSHHER